MARPGGYEGKEAIMTVVEMLYKKYCERVKTISGSAWKNVERTAKELHQHPAQVMYMDLNISENDIRANGGYGGELFADIDRMHKAKLLASNKHRQYYGHVTQYWLTKKGFKAINQDHSIC